MFYSQQSWKATPLNAPAGPPGHSRTSTYSVWKQKVLKAEFRAARLTTSGSEPLESEQFTLFFFFFPLMLLLQHSTGWVKWRSRSVCPGGVADIWIHLKPVLITPRSFLLCSVNHSSSFYNFFFLLILPPGCRRCAGSEEAWRCRSEAGGGCSAAWRRRGHRTGRPAAEDHPGDTKKMLKCDWMTAMSLCAKQN